MKKFLIAAVLAFSAQEAHAQAIIDVMELAGKTEKQVSAYLGEPLSCSKTKCGSRCQYERRETEIVFHDGKADWITIEGIDRVPFSEAALGSLGLKGASPSFVNPEIVMRWNSIPGLLEVNIFRGGGSFADYAYIQVEHAAGNLYCPNALPAHQASANKAPKANPLAQIHVGAYASSSMAYDAWNRLKNAFPKEFENQSPTVIEVNSGGRSLYRLVSGPMENAHDVCAALRAKQQACIVVPN